MSTPSTERLLELAARCEAATGPDRALDYDIAHFVTGAHFTNHGKAPAYTASLDAAMQLVPNGHRPLVAKNLKDDRWHATVSDLDEAWFHLTREAATPALAFCAAALRSLAEAGEGK